MRPHRRSPPEADCVVTISLVFSVHVARGLWCGLFEIHDFECRIVVG
jgi:hypothetical protein